MTLVDAEDRAAQHDTFELPPRQLRERLVVGHVVKLIFKGHGAGGEIAVERMWVEITDYDRAVGEIKYRGKLANNPGHMVDLKYGDDVVFGPEHVIAVEDPPGVRA